MAKEFCTRTDCSDAELAKRVNDGWDIHFMQFMADNKLNVVFVREAKPVPTTQPFVGVVMPVDKPRVMALTHFTARPMTAPVEDPVLELAKARAGSRYQQVMADGAAMLNQASKVFYQGRKS